MIAIAFAVLWAGYGITTYGWILLKGYDVPFTAWFNPVHPYSGRWPPGPAGDNTLFPTGTNSGTSGGPGPAGPASGANAANPAGGAVASGSPQPGVQGRAAGGHGR